MSAFLDSSGPLRTRHYGESLAKVGECVELMNKEKVDFLIELGDLKDQDAEPEEKRTLEYLKRIEAVLAKFKGPRYHVLGNHDMDSLSKAQFLKHVKNTGIPQEKSYYSFDVKGLHGVVLDANYKSDGADYDHNNFKVSDTNIPGPQLAWLEKDLAGAKGPVIVFVHQPLFNGDKSAVQNAAEVHAVLKDSGKVLAAFQGHQHQGGYKKLDGIHYCTLKAVVEGSGPENNSYAILDVDAGGNIVVTGYRKAVSQALPSV